MLKENLDEKKLNKDESENNEKTNPKKINILWMYPDILNNYGDRGNIAAIENISKQKNIEIDMRRVDNFKNRIDFNFADLIIFGSGELRTMKAISDRLKENEDDLKKYIENGKHIFVFNQSVSIFADKIFRRDKTEFDGLNYLNLDVIEKEYNYGDNICVQLENGLELMGVSIGLSNYKLKEAEPFSKVLFGYGNEYNSKYDGAKYKNLIWTNVLGPLFFKNPWYAEQIIDEIVLRKELELENELKKKEEDNIKNKNKFSVSNIFGKIKSKFSKKETEKEKQKEKQKETNNVEYKEFNVDEYIEKYPLEVKSYKLHKKYILEKEKADDEYMEMASR